MFDLDQAIWRKSTRSNNGGACVEVATNLTAHGVVLVRDTKNRDAGHLTLTPATWQNFTDSIRAGEFDL